MLAFYVNAQQFTSSFFNHPDKQAYTVFLEAGSVNILSKSDRKKLIECLATYKWIERSNKILESLLDNRYGYYSHTYQITITHPDNKRTVKVLFDAGGISEFGFFIWDNNHKSETNIRLAEPLRYEDVGRIKQLFIENVTNFSNVSYIPGERVSITPLFSFLFKYWVKLPAIYASEEDSKEFIRLYNTAFNSEYLGDTGDPVALFSLYDYDEIIQYDRRSINHYDYNLTFQEQHMLKLQELVKKIFQGHTCMDTITDSYKYQTIKYQYKDGLLHGMVKVYDANEKLEAELTYNNGLPMLYISYTPEGKKVKRLYFRQESQGIHWIEYDEQEEIKEQGYFNYGWRSFMKGSEMDSFYKN